VIGKAADTGPFARPDGSGRSIRDVLRVGHTLEVEVGPARLSVVFRRLLLRGHRRTSWSGFHLVSRAR
jgi:hypothetical protein